MRNVLGWIVNIIVLALIIRIRWWAYQEFASGDEAQQQQELLDYDKDCRIIADTGQCICRHRRNNELLLLHYEECVSIAKKP